jgi:protein-arginine kinase activator protein McsA
MWDIILEILELLGIISLKKKKKEEKESSSPETTDSIHKQDFPQGVKRESVPTCAGCHRPLRIGAIHESGKVWCTECYKTHVLKVKS